MSESKLRRQIQKLHKYNSELKATYDREVSQLKEVHSAEISLLRQELQLTIEQVEAAEHGLSKIAYPSNDTMADVASSGHLITVRLTNFATIALEAMTKCRRIEAQIRELRGGEPQALARNEKPRSD